MSGKKIPLCLVFQSACVDCSETYHNCRLKNGKRDVCKINAFAMLSNIDKAFCVETYFSTKSFSQTRRLLIKKLGWDLEEDSLAPNNATISRWVKEFKDDRLFHRKQGSGRPGTARSVESIRQVERSVVDSSERSVRHRAQSLGLQRTFRKTILRKDLRLHPYRIQAPGSKLQAPGGSRSASLAGSSA